MRLEKLRAEPVINQSASFFERPLFSQTAVGLLQGVLSSIPGKVLDSVRAFQQAAGLGLHRQARLELLNLEELFAQPDRPR